jgi:2'-5' RNA ligase
MTDNSMWIAFEVDKFFFPHTEDPHITLAYCGENYHDFDVESSHAIVRKLTILFEPVMVYGSETQLWHSKFLVLPLEVTEQAKLLRNLLVNSLFINNIWFSNKFGWNPHITLGKEDRFTIIPDGVACKRLFVHSRLGREYFNLQGEDS